MTYSISLLKRALILIEINHPANPLINEIKEFISTKEGQSINKYSYGTGYSDGLRVAKKIYKLI